MTAETIVTAVRHVLEEHKATDIQVLDVAALTPLTDSLVIATGASARQVRALADHVVEVAKSTGGKVLGVEGLETGEWVLVDLLDVVVHLMLPATREFYRLEELWAARPTRRAATGRPGR